MTLFGGGGGVSGGSRSVCLDGRSVYDNHNQLRSINKARLRSVGIQLYGVM